MVINSASAKARVTSESVSADLRSPDETGMGCSDHFQNNVMGHTIAICNRDGTLQIVTSDFWSLE